MPLLPRVEHSDASRPCSNYVRTGKLKLVYRGVEIIGPNSRARVCARSAPPAKQNKLWNLVDALYARQGAENSGWITNSVILAAASDAGVNARRSSPAWGRRRWRATLTTWQNQAKADQLQGTRPS